MVPESGDSEEECSGGAGGEEADGDRDFGEQARVWGVLFGGWVWGAHGRLLSWWELGDSGRDGVSRACR